MSESNSQKAAKEYLKEHIPEYCGNILFFTTYVAGHQKGFENGQAEYKAYALEALKEIEIEIADARCKRPGQQLASIVLRKIRHALAEIEGL